MKKNKIKISEAQLKDIIKESVKKVLKEDINGIMVTYYSPTKGNNQFLAKSIQDAERMIPSDATYFDITKGSNSTDEKNLISWGGKKGYWDNATNPDFKYGEKMKDREINNALNKRKF